MVRRMVSGGVRVGWVNPKGCLLKSRRRNTSSCFHIELERQPEGLRLHNFGGVGGGRVFFTGFPYSITPPARVSDL